MNRIPNLLLPCLLIWSSSLGAAEDILIADFEGADYGGWKVTGEAFGPGPARGALPGQMPVSGFQGKGLVNSFFKGDGSAGTLTSPPLRIQRPFINFLIGGGRHPGETCINLLVKGKVARTATGPNGEPGGSEELEWETWEVREFIGKEAVLEIIDKATGGWGHINVDHIVQSDARKAEPAVPEELYNETYRPQFHFTARNNWINDPNGLVYYRGEFHLFFQHNPRGINWGNMTWGHAVSKDLVHWQQLDNAIEPDHLGTIFSGSAVVDWHNTGGFQSGEEKPIVAIYTAAGGTSQESKGQPFTQCLAYSADRGRTWKKFPGNPVLKHIAGDNRDPKVVWYAPGKTWVMTLFLEGNTYTFLSSPDLKEWTRLHDLVVPGCGECPDFFELPAGGIAAGKKWVWTAASGKYLIGAFDGRRFVPDDPRPRQADWGANYYAVQSYSDIPEADGRRIQIAWMSGGKYPKMPFNQQMSFPCELKLEPSPEGLRLCRLPVKEIERLHDRKYAWAGKTLQPGENPLDGIAGDLFDLRAELEPAGASEFGFKIRGESIAYTVAGGKFACLGRSVEMPPVAGRIRLQILADRSSLEVFGNDGLAPMTSCWLPPRSDRSLAVYCAGGPVKLDSLELYTLKSIWPIR